MKSRKGAALMIVLMVMLVLGILITALWQLVIAQVNIVAWQSKNVQAHYLARSGVWTGVGLLTNELSTNSYTTMADLVAAMNARKNLYTASYNISGAGTFTIQYSAPDAATLKISSTGTTSGSSPSTSEVSLSMRLRFPPAMALNPDEWVSGINLRHSVNIINYLGHGVTLQGKVNQPVQSPQGGGAKAASIFKASVILFIDCEGISLKQINNTVSATFDAEVLYFQSGISLNSTNDPIYLSFSDEVAQNRLPSILSFTGNVGFEDVTRYQSFISGFAATGFYDRSSYYTSAVEPKYTFNLTGGKYGVIYLGQAVKSHAGSTIISPGYYFFQNGTDLRKTDNLDTKMLVRIDDHDIIIKAIESLFKYSVNQPDTYMWSKD